MAWKESLDHSSLSNYYVIMKANIVQIGNSQGIRIPKVLLQESGIRGEVDLEVCSDGILIRNICKPRSDWDARFRSMADHDDDVSTTEISATTEFESREWQW